MLLNNEFVVDAPPAQAWDFLTDLERVAACLPGAALEGRDGDAYVGGVKIKVGPISANFHGTARFVEQDDAAHSATISAAGKDPKGQAAANATIRARLEADGASRTRVLVDTDLEISGRMAQFGRGAIADVSVRLMNQFADNLSAQISGGADVPSSGTEPAPGPAPAAAGVVGSETRSAPAPAAEAGLDALSLIGPVVLKRLGPPLAAVLGGAALGWYLRGRRERNRPWTHRLLGA
jgi:carbon monoxide dehydrogenase subunit G